MDLRGGDPESTRSACVKLRDLAVAAEGPGAPFTATRRGQQLLRLIHIVVQNVGLEDKVGALTALRLLKADDTLLQRLLKEGILPPLLAIIARDAAAADGRRPARRERSGDGGFGGRRERERESLNRVKTRDAVEVGEATRASVASRRSVHRRERRLRRPRRARDRRRTGGRVPAQRRAERGGGGVRGEAVDGEHRAMRFWGSTATARGQSGLGSRRRHHAVGSETLERIK